MTSKILLALWCIVLTSSVNAQFFTSCSRNKVSNESLEKQVSRTQEHDEIPWVKLVKSEEEKVAQSHKKSRTYGKKLHSFTQSPTSKLSTERFYTIERAINTHAVLYGYKLVVPQPADLTQLRDWEVGQLATFFKQGTTYGTTHRSYLKTETRKYQDAVVEVKFHLEVSEHTAILLIDCQNRTIYLFIDQYKNCK